MLKGHPQHTPSCQEKKKQTKRKLGKKKKVGVVSRKGENHQNFIHNNVQSLQMKYKHYSHYKILQSNTNEKKKGRLKPRGGGVAPEVALGSAERGSLE